MRTTATAGTVYRQDVSFQYVLFAEDNLTTGRIMGESGARKTAGGGARFLFAIDGLECLSSIPRSVGRHSIKIITRNGESPCRHLSGNKLLYGHNYTNGRRGSC